MQDLGQFFIGETLDFKFNSHDTDGAPITLAGSPAVGLYTGNSTTESSSGVTLTVDQDSRTGMHHVRVATSGFSPGQYMAVLTEGTVDGVSVAGVQVARWYLFPATGAVQQLGYAESGIAQSGSVAGTLNLRSGSATVREGSMVQIIAGTGAGQSRYASADSSSALPVEPDWDVTPDNTSAYVVLATAPMEADSGLDAAGVRAAVGLASANLDTQLSGIQSDTDNIQTRLPAALVSGRMDASVGAMANNVMTAAAAASDLTTELQAGLATASGLTSAVAPLATSAEVAALDTVVDRVEADTQDIQSRIPAALDNGYMTASVKRVGTTTLTSTGTGGQGYGG